MSIGRRIKELKSVLHLTSAEIAKKIGIPVRTFGSYERDEAQPSPKFFNLMIDNFGVNANWLLTGKGEIFLPDKGGFNPDSMLEIKEKLNLSDVEITGLLEILNSDASRDMLIKFIQIKKGNKEALDSLIDNLQGIKAFL